MVEVKYLFCPSSYNGNFFKALQKNKRGKGKKIKINQESRRGFPEPMCSESLPVESCGLSLDSLWEQDAFTESLDGDCIWITLWLGGLVTLGQSDSNFVGTDQWLQTSRLSSKCQIEEISGSVLSSKYEHASRNIWLPEILKTKTKKLVLSSSPAALCRQVFSPEQQVRNHSSCGSVENGLCL